jgi:pyruvate kinase
MLLWHKSCCEEIYIDLSFTTNFKELLNKKQKASDLNVDRENHKRVKYDYKVNDLILLDQGTVQRKLVPKRDGPYQVIRVYSNGTLQIRKGIYVQRVSIRKCVPYFKSPDEGSKCNDTVAMGTVATNLVA